MLYSAGFAHRVCVLISIAFLPFLDATARAQTTAFVYALNSTLESNLIYGFRFDAASGTLTLLSGFPMKTGGLTFNRCVQAMAYGGGRLYALNYQTRTLNVFAVNRTTGALTELPFSPIALGSGGWCSVAVHPSGSPVVVGRGWFGRRPGELRCHLGGCESGTGQPISNGKRRQSIFHCLQPRWETRLYQRRRQHWTNHRRVQCGGRRRPHTTTWLAI